METSGLDIAILNSLLISISVAFLSGGLAIPLSWLICRSNLRGRSFFEQAFTLPYSLPGYLLAMAWITLGNPQVGWLRNWLPSSGVYGPFGIIFVETTIALAFPLMELCNGFRRLDPALEESARMSGAHSIQVFWRISAPLLRPAWINGMLLAFLYALSSFGVPAILGLPARYPVLTTWIFTQFRLGGSIGLQTGLILSLGMIAFSFVSLQLIQRTLRNRYALTGGKSSRTSITPLPRWIGSTLPIGLGSLLLLVLFLPWISLGVTALAPHSGSMSPAEWTLRNLSDLLTLPDFQSGLLHSLLLAVTTSLAITVGGFAITFTEKKAQTPFWKFWAWLKGQILFSLFSAPGSAIAILWILLGGMALGSMAFNPWIALTAAYLMKYSALGVRAFSEGLHQIAPVLDEAARISGASLPERILRLWVPLLKTSFAAAFAWSFFPIFTELTMSILLTGPGVETLGTVLFQLQEYADQQKASALAWMLLSFSLVFAAYRSHQLTPAKGNP